MPASAAHRRGAIVRNMSPVGRDRDRDRDRGAGNAEDDRTLLEQALLNLFEQEPPNLYERIEHLVLKTAYHYCSRNQLQTARLLGISRNVVRARLIQFGEISGSVRGTRHTQASRAPEAREITG